MKLTKETLKRIIKEDVGELRERLLFIFSGIPLREGAKNG